MQLGAIQPSCTSYVCPGDREKVKVKVKVIVEGTPTR